MLLSIGLIVKNEEKYLDKCLSALKNLRENLGAEVIVVDTGSNDSTAAIAKKYTDKVYFFEWCNDFAAARNETLKYAEGEWYLFFDADEILQNPEVIESFFTSGEYKNYESASYIKRNFTMTDLSCYSDQNTVRLVRRTPELHFEGIIHEQITPVNSPTKHLDALFYHYGYLYESEEDRKNKAMRNVELLEKQLEKNPSAFTYLQLAESLRGIDIQKAFNAACCGLEQQDCAEGSLCHQLLLKTAAAMCHQLESYDKALDYIMKFLAIEKSDRFVALEISLTGGYVLYDIGADIDICLDSFEDYYDAYTDYHSGGAAQARYTVSGVSPFEYRAAAYTAVSACIRHGRREIGIAWLERVPLSGFTGVESDIGLRIMIGRCFDNEFGTDTIGAEYENSCAAVQKKIDELAKK